MTFTEHELELIRQDAEQLPPRLKEFGANILHFSIMNLLDPGYLTSLLLIGAELQRARPEWIATLEEYHFSGANGHLVRESRDAVISDLMATVPVPSEA